MKRDAHGWFSVRCVLRVPTSAGWVYEERVTLWSAPDVDSAISLADAEATEYARGLEGEHLGLMQAFRLFDDPGQGAEVFSLMRRSELAPEAYLRSRFTTGGELQDAGEPPPEEHDGG